MMRSLRIELQVSAIACALLAGACVPNGDRDEAASSDRSAQAAVVLSAQASPKEARAWADPEHLTRLRDSLDASPPIEQPKTPMYRERDRGAGPECSPMPNAWIDLPLCRGR